MTRRRLTSSGGEDVSHTQTILLVTYGTVGLSVLLHGLSAAPLAARYAESQPPDLQPLVEGVPASHHRWARPG